MKYLKLFETKEQEYIVLLPSGEILEIGPNMVDMLWYDNETYNFDDYEIMWDYSLNMYKSKDKYKEEILKRNDMYFKKKNESFDFDWNDENFEEDEMDYILGTDMYFITVKSDKSLPGWANCLNVEKGIIKFITRHITYPYSDRYNIPNKTIYRYMWIPNKGIKSEFSEEYMKEILNDFIYNNLSKRYICFSTKDKLYDNLKTAINIASDSIKFIGGRYTNNMKNININELIENIDNDNFKYYIENELKRK